MWFGSSRRLLYLSVVVLLVAPFLQIWFCQVGAIRIFPANNAVANVEFSRGIVHIKKSKSKEDLFNKYFFSGRRVFGPSNNRTEKGFDESKRRVPSCPDPLHN